MRTKRRVKVAWGQSNPILGAHAQAVLKMEYEISYFGVSNEQCHIKDIMAESMICIKGIYSIMPIREQSPLLLKRRL